MDQSDSSSSNKDTFRDKLDKRKKLYQDYFKWVNSGFENEAKVEFSNLLKKGTSYTFMGKEIFINHQIILLVLL